MLLTTAAGIKERSGRKENPFALSTVRRCAVEKAWLVPIMDFLGPSENLQWRRFKHKACQ